MNEIGLFQKKKQTGGLDPLPLVFFLFSTLLMEIPDKTKLHPWKFHKILLDNLEFQGQKPRPLEISHHFFFTSFLINPSLIPLEIPFLNHPPRPPSVWFFSGKKPIPYLLIP